MDYVLTKRPDETLTINFVGTETLNSGDKPIILETVPPLTGVIGFSSVDYTTSGENDKQYLKIFYSYKIDDQIWSDQLPITGITSLTLCPDKTLDLKFYIYRVDDNNTNSTPIYFSNFKINGTFEYTTVDSIAILTDNSNQIVLAPKDIYKVFKLENFQVITTSSPSNYSIKYRFTQDNGRSFTKWENLTTENISTIRLNELRFAQIQYLIEKTSQGSSVKIYDIILTGDFQNISANYLKTNRYGLKQDCLTAYLGGTDGSSGNNSPNGVAGQNNLSTNGLSCYGDPVTDLTNNQDTSGYWKPYETQQITNFGNMMANQIASILGFPVDYYLTDPDVKGQDSIQHEYQLFNVIDNQSVTVVVPENNFPDNTIKFDPLSLDLLDAFEIHILKDEFKNKFGIEKRPNEKDFLYFCQTNRMYYIKHAQVHKDIMNSGIYYKVILEKYETKPNIQYAEESVKQKVKALTDNSTIDSLFGFEQNQELDKIANKDQLYPTSFDKIRHKINSKVQIESEKIYNGGVDFINQYYDFAGLDGIETVKYEKIDQNLAVSDNRSFICWFNFNNSYTDEKTLVKSVFDAYYINNKSVFNLLNNYDETNKIGYKIFYTGGKFSLTLNSQSYQLTTTGLTTGIWYGLLINLEQRQNLVDMRLYQRNTYYEITMFTENYQKIVIDGSDTTGITYYKSMGYKPVSNTEYNNGGNEFILLNSNTFENTNIQSFDNSNLDLRLIGSNIKYTNLRIFNDVISNDNIELILSQLIVVNTGSLILGDNANKKIQSTNYKTMNFR